MGSGQSVINRESDAVREEDLENEIANYQEKEGIKGSQIGTKRNVKRIFERQESSGDLDISSLLVDEPKDDATRALINKAFSGFFFLQSNDNEVNPKMELLLRGMCREEFTEGYLLINEGESGSKLYVVESGTLEVTINGTVIREMGRGSMLGELALLYDAPRSATVQCKTHCVLWSLSRAIFKNIQAISATANQIQRSRWLIQSPELATLSAIDLSRLVGTLQAVTFETGDLVITEGQLTSHIMLIEKGHASVTCSSSKFSSLFPNASSSTDKALKNEIDKHFGIYRPREGKRRSVEYMNVNELKSFLDNNNDIIQLDDNSNDETKIESSSETLCEVYEGCMVGIPALRAKAKVPDGWNWIKREDGTEGSEAPFTITALSPMHCLVFTVEVFENLFGPAEQALKVNKVEEKAPTEEIKKEIVFDSTKFKMKYILGSGSFGVVTLAEYRPDKNSIPEIYALKSLSKSTVIETHQLRHVLDERKLLKSLDNPFILKLYGTYQTPHQLVMVTEPLVCGDLWSVIYEVSPFCERCGLPFTLVQFYTANLVLGLSHIHSKGIIFRDLKPENIMLDEKGYLRIIDFGFSKLVPYTKKDSNGQLQVYAKTYTLCGTPEYLSPELIFNLGHNHASDIWALGVIIYEMLMAVTPFAPKRPDNVTELFTNIAMVKKNGLQLSSRIDQHTGNPQSRSLISAILKADPAERLGVQGGSTRTILDHPFFNGTPIEEIKNLTYVPEFIPKPNRHHEPLSNLQPVKPFHGDQSLFSEF